MKRERFNLKLPGLVVGKPIYRGALLGSRKEQDRPEWARSRCGTVLLLLAISAPSLAQTWVSNASIIPPNALPGELGIALKALGARLTNAATASTAVSGTLTDASGTRSVQITIQVPGYIRYQDSNSGVITYSGGQWQAKNTSGGQNDERIEESILAHFPDSVFLQIANGGAVRRIGGRFRTDDGKTPNYSGPYWTVYAFTPSARQGLTMGQALQQGYLIALDEKTGLISEVRIVLQTSATSRQVIQTKFSGWTQQAGQWYPGQIVRLENGQQVLSMTIQQGSTSTAAAASFFQP